MVRSKVAFYLEDFTLSGGTERSCISVMNALCEMDRYEIHLFVRNSPDQISFFDINRKVKISYFNIESSKKQYFRLTSSICAALYSNKIDIFISVEVFSLIFTLPALLYLKKLKNHKVKIVAWEHFNFSVNLGLKLRYYARKLAARFANGIVVLTQRDVELWRFRLKIRGKILSINNPSPFPRQEHEYATESRNMIAIGRLTHQKGFDRLLAIWGQVVNESDGGLWKLVLIGSGEEEKALKKLSLELGLENSVIFAGQIKDVSRYYKEAAALLMTSRFEGLPMTLIEAQTYGLPIVAYDCLTGPAEIVNTENGILVPDGDEHAFVHAVLKMQKDASLRAAYSEGALLSSLKFSIEQISDRWNKFLTDLQTNDLN